MKAGKAIKRTIFAGIIIVMAFFGVRFSGLDIGFKGADKPASSTSYDGSQDVDATGKNMEPEKTIIIIKESDVYLNDSKIKLETLESELKKLKNKDKTVIIKYENAKKTAEEKVKIAVDNAGYIYSEE